MMINFVLFEANYPILAGFALNKRSKEYNKLKAMEAYKKGKPGLLEKTGVIPNRQSPTYTRRSKTGKLVVVKKGKRKGQNKLVSGGAGLGATLGTGAILKRGIKNLVREGLDKGIIKAENLNHTRAVGYGGTAAYLIPAIATGTFVYKKFRGDRAKK